MACSISAESMQCVSRKICLDDRVLSTASVDSKTFFQTNSNDIALMRLDTRDKFGRNLDQGFVGDRVQFENETIIRWIVRDTRVR